MKNLTHSCRLASDDLQDCLKIRVVFCAYSGIFADTVIKTLQETPSIQLVGLVYSQRIFSAHENWVNAAIRLIKIAGLNYAILQFLQTDLYLLLRRFSGFATLENTLPIYRTKNINTETGLDFLKNLNPDVILLANFNQKISAEVISLPTVACLNIHPSLLPNFKGVDPVFAALYANEKLLGVTVHQVDESFDTGNIIAQMTMVTRQESSVFYHQLQLFQQGAQLAVNVIKKLPHSLVKQTQNTEGNYDSWPTKAKLKIFKQQGKRLIKLSEYMNAIKTLSGLYCFLLFNL